MKKIIVLILVMMAIGGLYSQNVKKALKLMSLKDYANAAAEFEKIIPEIINNFGINDTNYLPDLYYYTATCYENLFDFNKAENNYISALQIFRNLDNGIKNYRYNFIANAFALFYSRNGKYTQAKEMFVELQKNVAQNFGTNHSLYYTIISNLGNLYFKMSDFDRAFSLLQEAQIGMKNLYGEQDLGYLSVTNDLAGVYLSLGDYKNAEKLYIEVLNQKKQVFGTNHLEYALICNNLGFFYYEVGNYPKAEQYHLEALRIREKISGKNSLDYAVSCNNLAAIYTEKKLYNKAESLYIVSKNIKEQFYGKYHNDYALSCNNLANLYYLMGQYNKAEQLHLEALSIRKKILGRQHSDYALTCANLATLYVKMGKISKTKKYLFEAAEINKTLYGTKHFYYTNNIFAIAKLYYYQKKPNKAVSYFVEVNKNIENIVKQMGFFMSQNEREKFYNNTIVDFYDVIHSFYYTYREIFPQTAGIFYNNALFTKGLLLRSSLNLKYVVDKSTDEELKKLYEQWTLNLWNYNNQLQRRVSERTINLDSLGEIINQQEKQLYASKEFEDYTSLNQMNWQDIQKSLKTDEAAIEFINFRYHDGKKFTDSVFYCALIISKELSTPKIVFIGEQLKLSEIIIDEHEGNNDFAYVKLLYDKNSRLANRLYNLIWQPLEQLLTDKKTIYISASGLLNLVAFNSLITPDNSYLSDKYNIQVLSSTHKITQKRELYLKDIENTYLYGGIDYSPDLKLWLSVASKFYSREAKNKIDNIVIENPSNAFVFLKGADIEVDNIEKILQKSKSKINIFKYKGLDALEENIKYTQYTKPSIIHIATHGFYFTEQYITQENEEELMRINRFIFSKNPLQRSGIAFTGANWKWENQNIDLGIEDGILTASEIANLSMSQVKLVVLSACQTGLGDIVGTEGVFGLQRGFKNAGVEYLIIALWSVPDQQTQELMSEFYKNLSLGYEIRQAFKIAQNKLKEQYRDVEGGAYAWAAFVLLQ